MNETNKEDQKRFEAEKIMAMTNFKKFYPEHSGATVEKIVEKEVIVEVIKEVIKEVMTTDPEVESELAELKDALSDALNAEQAAKKECEECKQQLDSFIRENAKLNEHVLKLKKALAEFTIQ